MNSKMLCYISTSNAFSWQKEEVPKIINFDVFQTLTQLLRDVIKPGFHRERPLYIYISRLEKLTNANRSVSTGNDRLFPVELAEIADWKSMSEYMLHSNFGKKLTRVIGGNFGAYSFILSLPYFLNICLSFWMFYQTQ